MGEKLTSIGIVGKPYGYGIQDWGVKTPEEMVAMYRKRADYLREIVKAIDETKDADFRVYVVKGAHIQKLVSVLQEGRDGCGRD